MASPAAPILVEPKNLLIRGVNWLGDAVMTTPAILRLRERFPQARITLLASARLADLWLGHPGLDRTITFSPGESPWSVGRRLRGEGFDAAVVFPNSLRSALEAWWARIPCRVGSAGHWRRLLLTHPVASPRDRPRLRKRGVREIKRLLQGSRRPGSVRGGYVHQMNDYLEVVSALGANPQPLPPALHLDASETDSAIAAFLADSDTLKSRQGTTAPPVWLGLNPGAAYGPAKCWPAERFAQTVREVSKRVPAALWVCLGADSDRQIGQTIVDLSQTRVLNLAGKTSLRQLMALLKKCRVLLTNDSGPMHVAAALGTPVVVPFGSTTPALTAPGQPGDRRHHLLQSDAACAPCFRRTCPVDFRCMTGIGSDQVVAAILEALQPR